MPLTPRQQRFVDALCGNPWYMAGMWICLGLIFGTIISLADQWGVF